ncbi:SET and MYND domain-containing protein 4 [Ostrinia furnacalis]|uniref:SET and MYND domain-containing protein 4 n=1 Tax=Ostrinia furnacalis TaxID=93504 RepID=UPI00103BAA73|nr:SET and MYND domain-containing protein 4 [Ostrinia furnacalis]
MSIDSCYEGVLAKLNAQGKIRSISQQLICTKDIHDKVLIVYDILEGLEAFPKILDVEKCEKVSTYYRNQGNKKYQRNDNYGAWQYYNLSLLHAPLHSECYCLALANRSAVFSSLEKWAECIKDIDTVFSMKYPEKLTDKLNKRKSICIDKVTPESEWLSPEIRELLTLKDPQMPRFPCASSKLEVVFSNEMGRHVVAKCDIKVGDILIQEEPYFKLLLKHQYLFTCSYCLSRSLNLLPCHSCCFSLYCSVQCKDSAWKDYHETECPLMATLVELKFTTLELLALRTVIKARNDHADWDSLFKTIQEAEENAGSEFRGHVKVNNEWVYDSKYYTSIHTLASNIEKRSISNIFQKAVTAAVFLFQLSQKTKFLESDNEEEQDNIRKYAAGNLLHHIMTSATNMHGISGNVESAEGNFVDEFNIGSAPYAFHSLLNHSCAPNVVRCHRLGTARMTLVALRPIKKGMQLYDNYGAHHAIDDRNTRQGNLKFQYKFTCLCEACVNDWPTHFTMQRAKNLPAAIVKHKDNILNTDALDNLQKGDLKTAERIYKPLCEIAQVLEPYAPCLELSDCQESIKQCLQIFGGLVPYGYSQQVEWNAAPPKL